MNERREVKCTDEEESSSSVAERIFRGEDDELRGEEGVEEGAVRGREEDFEAPDNSCDDDSDVSLFVECVDWGFLEVPPGGGEGCGDAVAAFFFLMNFMFIVAPVSCVRIDRVSFERDTVAFRAFVAILIHLLLWLCGISDGAWF